MRRFIQYLITGLIVSFWYSASLAQQFVADSTIQLPEKIYGKNKVLKSNEYYIEQIGLWKIEIDKNPENPDAWFNYYRANRNAYIKGEETDSQKAKGNSRFDRLKSIVEEMERYVPESFEYNFVKWSNGNNDFNLFPFLDRAYQLSPKNPDVLISLVFYNEIKGNYIERNRMIKAFYDLGEYSPGLMNYSYNLLSGLDQNAIVFTEGDKDTEAGLLLQYGRAFRPDVQILNVNLLLIKEYRDHVFKELNIEPLSFEPMENTENYERFHDTIVYQVSKNNSERPVYVAVNVSDQYTRGITEKLHLTGLAYLFSTDKIDEISYLKRNIEQVYALDYLKVYFPHDISVGNVDSMNENYILPFSVLSKYYLLAGNSQNASYYKDLALKISIKANREDLFGQYFKQK